MVKKRTNLLIAAMAIIALFATSLVAVSLTRSSVYAAESEFLSGLGVASDAESIINGDSEGKVPWGTATANYDYDTSSGGGVV